MNIYFFRIESHFSQKAQLVANTDEGKKEKNIVSGMGIWI
jgi:hypothetical protein